MLPNFDVRFHGLPLAILRVVLRHLSVRHLQEVLVMSSSCLVSSMSAVFS